MCAPSGEMARSGPATVRRHGPGRAIARRTTARQPDVSGTRRPRLPPAATERGDDRQAGHAPLRRAVHRCRRGGWPPPRIRGSFMRKIAVEMSAIRRWRSLSRHRWRSRRRDAGTPGPMHAPIRIAAEHGREGVGHVVPLERPPSRSASRTARSRTPRCPRACRRACPAPARDSCTPPCRGSSPACVIAGMVMVGDRSDRRRRRPASCALARPKSSTFTVPSGRTLMFAGFRSRWMIPCSCAASQRFGNLLRDRQRLVEWHRTARDALRQIVALRRVPSRGL